MSKRLPEELRRLSRVLMAGEEVVLMEKPDLKTMLIWEGVLAGGAFVVLIIFISIFSDLPMYLKAAASVVFSLAAGGVLHFAIATTTYVITDKRLMIVNDLGSELKDSCEFEEIKSTTKIRFGHQLVVERTNGIPIRLVALKNRDEVEKLLIDS